MELIGSSLRKLAESRGLEITSSKQTLKKLEVIDVFDCARFCFFDRLRVWSSRHDHREGNLAGLPNRIELNERFWEEIRAHPVPGELNVVRGLANSPGCLNFYLWLTWRCHLARGNEKIRLFGPTGLQVQLGLDDYLRERDFRRTIARWLATVRACWPECPVRLAPYGENIYVSPASAIHKRL
jgi:Plasmid encoded RepA protein